MVKAGLWLEFYAMGTWIMAIIMAVMVAVSEVQRIDLLTLPISMSRKKAC